MAADAVPRIPLTDMIIRRKTKVKKKLALFYQEC
ncbi:MAG: hypothetical protein K0S47_2555 [Herbinix sp.]|jgi:hypothetical protein|nr:hypothetical protein [Herbinix sp.]